MSAIGPARATATARTDWETPPLLFDLLDQEFRFTLDAAASDANHKCERFLTEEEDALAADVFNEVVFCNPPYGKGLMEWIKRFGAWSFNQCTVVALLPANTDTAWFAVCWLFAHEIRFLHGRVQFVGGGNSNTGGSMVVVFRPNPLTQVPEGSPAGVTMLRIDPPRVSLWDWRREVSE